MSLHQEIVPQVTRMLTQVESWLDIGAEHARKKGIDMRMLLDARLAPDMFPLYRQVQSACDHGKFAAARVAGREPPKHPDGEQSLEELVERLRSVRQYVASFTPVDFEGAEGRVITLPFLPPGKGIMATDYLRELSLPNFYFHATTAYGILRHNGVELGKRNYLGMPTLRDV